MGIEGIHFSEVSSIAQLHIAPFFRLSSRNASSPLLETMGDACIFKISSVRLYFENKLRSEEQGNRSHAHIQAGVSGTIQLFPSEVIRIFAFWRQVSKAWAWAWRPPRVFLRFLQHIATILPQCLICSCICIFGLFPWVDTYRVKTPNLILCEFPADTRPSMCQVSCRIFFLNLTGIKIQRAGSIYYSYCCRIPPLIIIFYTNLYKLLLWERQRTSYARRLNP